MIDKLTDWKGREEKNHIASKLNFLIFHKATGILHEI